MLFRSDLRAAQRERARAGMPNDIRPDDLYPDAIPALEAIRAAGYLVGVAGNQPQAAEALFHGLDVTLDLVASSETLGFEKPDARFFAAIAERLSVTPGEVATFLMLEQRFPRSLVFCLQEADQRLASIRSPGDEAFPPLRCQARLAALATFFASRRAPDEDLHALLTHVVDETAAICGELHEELFQAPQRAWSNGRVERPRAEA